MIHDAANPEDPGTQLCTPELHTRAAPPSIHSCQGRTTLSPDPNLFYSNDDQNEFVRDLKSELLARRSCPDFDSVKISQSQIRMKKKEKKRMNSASSSQKQKWCESHLFV